MKKTSTPLTTVTRDLKSFSEPTGNIYESVVIMSKRANQIGQEQKEELEDRLQEFTTFADTDEMVENEEQIELSRYFEQLPKPSLVAAREFENDEIYWRNPAKENQVIDDERDY